VEGVGWGAVGGGSLAIEVGSPEAMAACVIVGTPVVSRNAGVTVAGLTTARHESIHSIMTEMIQIFGFMCRM
jgi:tetrahydromethanopterin S-methyltransferase subunit D